MFSCNSNNRNNKKNMKIYKQAIVYILLCLSFIHSPYVSAGDLSSDSYELHFTDLNNDGHLDLFHQAKDATNSHGSVLGNTSGTYTERLQLFFNGHLGLNWDTSTVNILTGQLNLDSYSDLLLQPRKSGNQIHIIAANNTGRLGQLNTISASWPDSTLGINWAADKSNVLTGNFSNTTKTDLFVQSKSSSGMQSLVLIEPATGTPSLHQQWPADYLGLQWSKQTHKAYLGDFNGDGLSDIYLQAKYPIILIPMDDLIIPIPIEPKTYHSILLADANGKFNLDNPDNLISWDNTHLGLDKAWMAENSNIIIGDYNGDGKDDIFLQGKNANSTHYLLLADSNGSGQFTTQPQSWQDGHLGQNWSSRTNKLIVNDFNNDGKADFLIHNNSNIQNVVLADTNGQFTEGTSVTRSDITSSVVGQVSNLVRTPTSFGKLDGEFAVDQNGNVSYAIPIAVPPGIGGMQPSLSLSYSSSAGNSLVGVGWALSGMSSIHRCAKNYAQDGELDSVRLDANDKLCLDGQRLIAVTGVYGKVDTEYRTEMDSFARIIGKGGDINSSTAWFQVETKKGQLIEYGRSTDSTNKNSKANGSIVTSAWLSNKVTDAAGNYLTTSYYQNASTGEHYPLQIDYTFNDNAGSEIPGTTPALFSVKFVYTSRSDETHGYIATAKSTLQKRLFKIETYAASEPVKTYFLDYETDQNTRASRLRHVAECDAVGNCKASTEFNWQNGQRWPTTSKTTSVCNDLNCGDYYAIEHVLTTSDYADINGDGYMDMCFKNISGVQCLIGSKTGYSDSNLLTPGIPASYEAVKYVDFNNDGKADLMYRTQDGLDFIFQMVLLFNIT